MRSMLCTQLMPRFLMAALCPMCVFGKRPFFLMMIFMANKTMLTAIITSVSNKVFNIFIIFA